MNRKEMLLTIAMEECSEVAQALSKVLRFGSDDVYGFNGIPNKEKLANECNDLYGVFEMLIEERILSYPIITRQKVEMKKEKIEKYLKYSKEVGTLTE